VSASNEYKKVGQCFQRGQSVVDQMEDKGWNEEGHLNKSCSSVNHIKMEFHFFSLFAFFELSVFDYSCFYKRSKMREGRTKRVTCWSMVRGFNFVS
jgi:hypothetical protein